MSLSKKVQMLVLLALILPSAIFAKSKPGNHESYAYTFIARLYALGERDGLEAEIRAFTAEYPGSVYHHNLRLISANLLQEKGMHKQAITIYDELLRENIDLGLRHQTYLNRAISLLASKEYAEGLYQLDLLENQSQDTSLLARSHLYRARTYRLQGQYYAAVKSYHYIQENDPALDIDYDYLDSLLKLDKSLEAKLFVDQIDFERKDYVKCHLAYCIYLLDNSRFSDLDGHLMGITEIHTDPNIELVRLRAAFSAYNYALAEAILQEAESHSDYHEYYRGLLQVKTEEYDEADEIFRRLVSQADAQIKVLAYLERLKMLYSSEPHEAIRQLKAFMAGNNKIVYAQQLFTMSHFAFALKDYPEALRYLSLARAQAENRLLLSEIDYMVAQSWYELGMAERASESFNRYLNQYPDGNKRAAALFYLGTIYFDNKDYALATSAFSQIMESFPDTGYAPNAELYLAEIDFFQANYNRAYIAYTKIYHREPEVANLRLRMAQCDYYLERYDSALQWLEDEPKSYDSHILVGHIHFNLKDFDKALESFEHADNYADSDLMLREVKSYRALTLYQLKRYDEASALYLELYDGKESPDTFLYLGAKAAYASSDYNLAIQLFENFVEENPESELYLHALADIANTQFNMGKHGEAIDTYQSILSRFRNKIDFSGKEQGLLAEVFTGLELCLLSVDPTDYIDELADSIDSYKSHYLRFELSYLITRLYAQTQDWADVLDRAERIRESFPDYQSLDVNLLMAQSLIRLNEYDRADTLLAGLYEESGDLQALLFWAELDMLYGDFDAALEKYHTRLSQSYSKELWLLALKASQEAGYQDFAIFWEMGSSEDLSDAEAKLLYLTYLIDDARYAEARDLADALISDNLDPYYHAKAFYYIGLIRFNQSYYIEAIKEFKKLSVLFPEYADIQDDAAYHSILSYIRLGARDEARLQLLDSTEVLSERNRNLLFEMLGEDEE